MWLDTYQLTTVNYYLVNTINTYLKLQIYEGVSFSYLIISVKMYEDERSRV
jgi:hypothetical protein